MFGDKRSYSAGSGNAAQSSATGDERPRAGAQPRVPPSPPPPAWPSASVNETGEGTASPDRLGVLNVEGRLDNVGLELLRMRCRAEVEAKVTTLVLDFTGMTDFPSALFRLLHETGAVLQACGAKLHMIGLKEAIEYVVRAAERPPEAMPHRYDRSDHSPVDGARRHHHTNDREGHRSHNQRVAAD